MKKVICVLVVLCLSSLVTLYGKKISHLIHEKPKSKTVCFSVYATDYSAPIFKKSKAKVTLSICRFTNGQKEVVWEGVVDKGTLKNYPGKSKPLYREVSICNAYDRAETYAAYYKVEYVFKKSKMYYEEGAQLPSGSNTNYMRISI